MMLQISRSHAMRRYVLLFAVLLACEEEPAPTEADELGVGAQCGANNDCNPEDADTDGMQDQECLPQFKGGYCGLSDCTGDADCPEASKCVAHTDGTNYCFRICADKPECNYNRSPDNESNCSSNITFVDGGSVKACVPPSA
jgi:hypothetical protein